MRSTPFSSGIDFYIPNYSENFKKEFLQKNIEIEISEKNIIIKPLQRVLIPSGIKVKIPEGYCLIAFNKSGISTRKGLDVLACVIDEDYQGEVHISLVNVGDTTVYINYEEKIIQFLLLPAIYSEITEVSLNQLYEEKTIRGENGFGSTGNK